mgnify:CR=1 FL=1
MTCWPMLPVYLWEWPPLPRYFRPIVVIDGIAGESGVKDAQADQYIKQLEAYKLQAEALTAKPEQSRPRWHGLAVDFILGLAVGIGALFIWGEQTQVIVACEDTNSA